MPNYVDVSSAMNILTDGEDAAAEAVLNNCAALVYFAPNREAAATQGPLRHARWMDAFRRKRGGGVVVAGGALHQVAVTRSHYMYGKPAYAAAPVALTPYTYVAPAENNGDPQQHYGLHVRVGAYLEAGQDNPTGVSLYAGLPGRTDISTGKQSGTFFGSDDASRTAGFINANVRGELAGTSGPLGRIAFQAYTTVPAGYARVARFQNALFADNYLTAIGSFAPRFDAPLIGT